MGQVTAAVPKAWPPAHGPSRRADVPLEALETAVQEPGVAGVAWAWLALAVPFLGAWLQADAAAMGACVVAMAASPMVAAWWLDAPATVLHALLGGVLLGATWYFHPLAGSLGIPLGLYAVLACVAVVQAVARRGHTQAMQELAQQVAQHEEAWMRVPATGAQPCVVTSEDGAVTLHLNAAGRTLLRQPETGLDERWLPVAQRAPLLGQSPVTTELTDAGGLHVPVGVVMLPVRWAGRPAWLWVLEDRRVQAQVEKDLFKAQRLATVGQMVSGVTHELNNALTCVLNNVEYALADDADASEAHQALGDAEEAARHIQSLLGDLRAFGRAEDGPAQPVSVVPVLDTSLRLCHATLKHAAQVVTEYQQVPCVMGAPQVLTGVFVGLLLHAVKACGKTPGGADRVLTLRTRTVAGRVVVEVELPEGVALRPGPDEMDGTGLATVTAQLASLGGRLETRQTVGHWTFVVSLPGETMVENAA